MDKATRDAVLLVQSCKVDYDHAKQVLADARQSLADVACPHAIGSKVEYLRAKGGQLTGLIQAIVPPRDPDATHHYELAVYGYKVTGELSKILEYIPPHRIMS